ncbi:AAA family ATPase [bacterium]|jgi:hypothetical protein|nr:AAA family ATPase [bacterium]MBT6832240.1 AAA family ATPase [bacterium]MBT6996465.1 AAA family ATPase [bacterium]MBT7772287.1 AAA family ATPase [bacterium]
MEKELEQRNPKSQNWENLTKHILPVTNAYLKAVKKQITFLEKQELKIDPDTFKENGRFVEGFLHGYPDLILQILKTGSKLKFISKSSTDERAIIVDAVIQSIFEEKGNTSSIGCQFKAEKTSKGSIDPLTVEIQIDPAVDGHNIEKKEKLFRSVAKVSKNENNKVEGFYWKNKKLLPPAKTFLNGSFPKTPPEIFQNEPHPTLDKEQNRAYQMAMDIENHPVLFLQGPSGTGKTTTEVEIIKSHIDAGRRVLLLSHSNNGVEVPMLKLIKSFRKKSEKHLHIAGNSTKPFSTIAHKLRMKRDAPKFPKTEIRKINAMSDEQIFENFLRPTDEWKDHDFNAFCETFKSEPISPFLDIAGREKMKAKDLINFKTTLLKEARQREIRFILDDYKSRTQIHREKTLQKLEVPGVSASTFGTLINDKILENEKFDVVMIDEATRMRSEHLIQALQKAGKQIIFVGDPEQLGNNPLERETKIEMYDTLKKLAGTKHEIIEENIPDVVEKFEDGPFSEALRSSENPEKELPFVFLAKNRRSLPNITNVLSELMYNGKMKAGRQPEKGSHAGVIRWYDTKNLETTERTSGTSKTNSTEAKFIVEKILKLIKRKKNPVAPEDLGIIAAYKPQAKLILTYLERKLGHNKNAPKNLELFERMKKNIATVDKFQGDQRKIVFISMVRSNPEGVVGFLEDERRIGVAIGRGADKVYIVGNSETLVEQNTNPKSKEFMGKTKSLVEKYGDVFEIAA